MSILPIFIPHLGCPHQCVFCKQKTISGQQTAALEGAKEQINKWLKILDPGTKHEAAFYGGSFTGLDLNLQEELLKLTDDLFYRGIIESVRLSTRPDYIDEPRLALLKAHHVKTIELGVQSLDDKVLAKAERGHSSSCVYEACSLIKAQGFTLGVQLMVGLPLQDFLSVQSTCAEVLKIKPDLARIYPVLVIKATPLAKSFTKGEYEPLSLEEAVSQATYLYRKLTAAGVKVIRIGLQPDEELCEPGNILAGPFHASMGELVKSRALREELEEKIQALANAGAKKIILKFTPNMESKLRGKQNANLKYLQQRFSSIYLELRKENFSGSAGSVELLVEQSSNKLIGGEPMPFVNIKITKEGNVTAEQKSALIQGATQLLVDVLGKNPKTTVVIIEEVETDNWGIGGESITQVRKKAKAGQNQRGQNQRKNLLENNAEL